MKNIKIIFFIFLFILFAACSSDQSSSKNETNLIDDKIDSSCLK